MTNNGTKPPGRRDLPCELVQDLLPMYVEGELHSRTRSMVRRHLESCSVCSRVRDEGDVMESLGLLHTLMHDANVPDVPDESKLFVTVDETLSIGTLSITIERILFDHSNTIIMYDVRDREGEGPQRRVHAIFHMTDDHGHRYRGGSGFSGVSHLDPVQDDATEVTLSASLHRVGGDGETPPVECETPITVPVRKPPPRVPAALENLNDTREIGDYRFILDWVRAGYSRTMLQLRVEPTEGRYTRYDPARSDTAQVPNPEPRYFAFSWTPGYCDDIEMVLEEAPGSGEPLALEPTEQRSYAGSPWPYRGRHTLMDYETKSMARLITRAPIFVALIGGVSGLDDIKWLNTGRERSGIGGWPVSPYRFSGTFSFRSDPIPSSASTLLFELPQVFLYRYFDRTFTVKVPEDAPPILSSDQPERHKSAEAAGAVTVPIHSKFSYDGVYIVLEDLEVWPGSYYLRYHVETPSGRLITGDYDLIIGTLHKDEDRFLRGFGNHHHPDVFEPRRGVRFSRSDEDEVTFIVCAIGEHHGALSWEIDLA